MSDMASTAWQARGSIPAAAGIGLRAVHQDEIIECSPQISWLEAHTENYFAAGGAQLETLNRIREDYPLSLHGVGLSLGSADPLNEETLAKVKELIDRFAPEFVSEHLCWTSIDGRHLNDLLPLPYTQEALEHVIKQISHCQERLGRQILLENVSSYLQFNVSEMPEWEFFSAVAQGADCGILLDINNVYVNACNHDFDAKQYIAAISPERVGEIHLAGHAVNRIDDQHILIDTHDGQVSEDVWRLYEYALARIGARPTLIEWDNKIPSLGELIAEADKAEHYLAVNP